MWQGECRAFINEATLEILKTVWNDKGIGYTEIFEKRAIFYHMRPSITTGSEFEIERNNSRFPSRYSIGEAYYGFGGMDRSGRFLRSRTTIVYREVKFFTATMEKNPLYIRVS